MAIITQNDFVGENKKCSYVLAYFKSHNLNIGDEWNPLDYNQWIRSKHSEFHRIKGIPECVTYWTGHNEELLKEFERFIGYEENASIKKYSVMVVKYGYAVVEAENEAEALERTKGMSDSEFDWSDFYDEQVVEEVDYE